MTKKKKQETADRIVQCREESKKLFREASKLLTKLVDECEVDEEIELSDGRLTIVVDNFDTRYTAFKTVGFDQYDLQVIDDR